MLGNLAILKLIDIALICLLIIFSIGFMILNLDYGKQLHLPEWFYHFIDALLWPIFSLLLLELYIKYRKVGSLKMLFRKHWLDILMLILIPFIGIFKLVKLFKVYKILKIIKTKVKIAYKLKKLKHDH